jgi:(p)ppGpp synthase/HD superfamily hydrolase
MSVLFFSIASPLLYYFFKKLLYTDLIFIAFGVIIQSVILMIYTKLTMEAMKLAYSAHHGQVDKSNVPYIFHPYHLAEQMDDEASVCVALLHDVIEDTDITIEQLRSVFPSTIVDAVALMTHNEDEDYLTYVKQIKTNPLARKVKLADLRHNTDTSRMPDADAKTLAHYHNKYQKAFEILEEDYT